MTHGPDSRARHATRVYDKSSDLQLNRKTAQNTS
ncbi:hypothetical protein EUX98_g3060 [Antrodiella citrinella]|uniref:Uncharacterized protein n=1 Tax=Antrodiella citrinella TaxID=2447956 RepID=A0A4S4MXF0_9APHY|nr:hypothetical protein EUX98_g3060 [Antrodiella citrinella]